MKKILTSILVSIVMLANMTMPVLAAELVMVELQSNTIVANISGNPGQTVEFTLRLYETGNIGVATNISVASHYVIDKFGWHIDSTQPNLTYTFSNTNGNTVDKTAYVEIKSDAIASSTPYSIPLNCSITTVGTKLNDVTQDYLTVYVNAPAKVTPTITAWPTASNVYGQTLAVSTLTGGSASYNGVTVPGTFSFNAPTTTPNAGTASFAATFTPTDTSKYNSVSGTISVTTNKADSTIGSWPTASDIVYGQTLAASTLTGGSASYNGTSVSGTFSFNVPSTLPNAGDNQGFAATFTPADTANYNIVSGTINVNVKKADAMVSTWPTASSITYGQTLSDSVLSGGSTSVPGSFSFTNPATVPSAGTESFAVTFTPADTVNYNSVSGSVSITINKKAATVTPNAASKTYGENDPALTGTLEGFLSGDNVTASYSREPGENAGTYAISGTLATNAALSNYDIKYNTAEFTINKKAATVTPNAASKTYGEDDPALTGTLSGFLEKDNVTASYSRESGENVGTYAISGTLATNAALSNYDIKYNTAEFTINKKAAAVTPNAASKTYGEDDPVLTGTLEGFLPGDNVTASYSRESGENAGTYAISGTLATNAALSNYDIKYNTAEFIINKKAAAVTPNTASKTYGEDDPVLTGTLEGFLPGDNVTASYSREPGENTGTYAISGTLATNAALSNYDIKYNTAEFIINKKAAAVTPNTASKTYGENDPVLTGTLEGFLPGDNVTASYSREPGENAGTYAISGTLATNAALSNYDIKYNTAEFTINKKAATVISNAASKFYGDADPVLTGTLSGFLEKDNVTATYSRTAGENVGTYTINGTLVANPALSNYNITYKTADFKITYKWFGILQPINYPADTAIASNMSRFKAGSTIPVKFQLGNKAANATAQISYQYYNSISGTVNEEVSYATSTGGTVFRYDAVSDQYVYNMSTKGMLPGIYKLTIKLNDGNAYSVFIGIK